MEILKETSKKIPISVLEDLCAACIAREYEKISGDIVECSSSYLELPNSGDDYLPYSELHFDIKTQDEECLRAILAVNSDGEIVDLDREYLPTTVDEERLGMLAIVIVEILERDLKNSK